MLKNLERKVKITVYQSQLSEMIIPANQSDAYIVRYNCVNCKNVIGCNNPTECHLVRYIQERVPQTHYSCQNNAPQLHLFVSSEVERLHAIKVIKRAQRLRSNRLLSR